MNGVAAVGSTGDDPALSVSIEHGEGDAKARVQVAGEVDVLSVGELSAALGQIIAGGATEIHLDLGGVSFLDSTGLTALLTARAQLEGRGSVTVDAASPAVRRTFEIAGLDRVFGTA